MQRLLALANALDGMSRADAARAAGIERQALRDAVVRYSPELNPVERVWLYPRERFLSHRLPIPRKGQRLTAPV